MEILPALEFRYDIKKERLLCSEDVDVWIAKLLWVWTPARVIEIRQREGGLGLLFVIELSSPFRLHVGVGRKGVDFCALWHGEQGVIWDSVIGFCSIYPPFPSKAEADELDCQIKFMIRRNCFLLGAPVEVSREEKRECIKWFAARSL